MIGLLAGTFGSGAIFLQQLIIFHHRQHADHFAGGITQFSHIFSTGFIGLQLIAPTVTADQRVGIGHTRFIDFAAAGEYCGYSGENLRACGFALLASDMFARDMTHLMGQYRDQLCFIANIVEQAAIDIDIVIASGEGIEVG